MYEYGEWNRYCKQRRRIFDQNGSVTTVQQRQIKQDDNQPTADHAIDFTRRPVVFAQKTRQLVLAFEIGINSRPTTNRPVSSGNPVSSTTAPTSRKRKDQSRKCQRSSPPHSQPIPGPLLRETPTTWHCFDGDTRIMSIVRMCRLPLCFVPDCIIVGILIILWL